MGNRWYGCNYIYLNYMVFILLNNIIAHVKTINYHYYNKITYIYSMLEEK